MPAPKSRIAGFELPPTRERASSAARSTTLYSAKYSGPSPDCLMFAACIARYSAANLSNSASSTANLLEIAIRDELHAPCQDELANARARQRVALRRPRVVPMPVASARIVVARMTHELGRAAGRQTCEHGGEIRFVEPAAEVEPDELVDALELAQRRQRAERRQRHLLRESARVTEPQHVAAHALHGVTHRADA